MDCSQLPPFPEVFDDVLPEPFFSDESSIPSRPDDLSPDTYYTSHELTRVSFSELLQLVLSHQNAHRQLVKRVEDLQAEVTRLKQAEMAVASAELSRSISFEQLPGGAVIASPREDADGSRQHFRKSSLYRALPSLFVDDNDDAPTPLMHADTAPAQDTHTHMDGAATNVTYVSSRLSPRRLQTKLPGEPGSPSDGLHDMDVPLRSQSLATKRSLSLDFPSSPPPKSSTSLGNAMDSYPYSADAPTTRPSRTRNTFPSHMLPPQSLNNTPLYQPLVDAARATLSATHGASRGVRGGDISRASADASSTITHGTRTRLFQQRSRSEQPQPHVAAVRRALVATHHRHTQTLSQLPALTRTQTPAGSEDGSGGDVPIRVPNRNAINRVFRDTLRAQPAPEAAAAVDVSAAARYGLTPSVGHLLAHTVHAGELNGAQATAVHGVEGECPQSCSGNANCPHAPVIDARISFTNAPNRTMGGNAGVMFGSVPRSLAVTGDSDAVLQELFPAVSALIPTGRVQRAALLGEELAPLQVPAAAASILPDTRQSQMQPLRIPAPQPPVETADRMLPVYERFLATRGGDSAPPRIPEILPPRTLTRNPWEIDS